MNIPEAAAFADALDGLGAGMFLVDETGGIIHVNGSGQVMLHERSVLRAADGKLVACDANAASALKKIFAAAGGGAVAVCTSDIAVPLGTRDGEHYVAHVLPLTSGARRRAGARYAAVAALFVHKVALEASFRPEAIATVYNLTPSELRVLLAIVEVGGVQGTAEALGIGEATVKTHLHRLFRKTGAARQADLVKLVAGFASPFDCQPQAPAACRSAANRQRRRHAAAGILAPPTMSPQCERSNLNAVHDAARFHPCGLDPGALGRRSGGA